MHWPRVLRVGAWSARPHPTYIPCGCRCASLRTQRHSVGTMAIRLCLLRQATAVTSLELAIIPAAAALVGVLIGIMGNVYLDRQRERRTAVRERDQAIAELLAATVDLVSGVNAARAAYHQQHATFRHYIRVSAGMLAAFGSTMTGAGTFKVRSLLDWYTARPVLDRLLAMDRDLDDRQRVVALDLATTVAPRTARFYAAVAVLTLGSDVKIANAVRDLTPAMGGLIEVIAANNSKFSQAHNRAEKALGAFRAVADQRR